jgi:hypothetical protein
MFFDGVSKPPEQGSPQKWELNFESYRDPELVSGSSVWRDFYLKFQANKMNHTDGKHNHYSSCRSRLPLDWHLSCIRPTTAERESRLCIVLAN